ncbi:hypothetical protein [Swingsia samuiensis]|uniref:Uncharacterized protein n=1 Tax=Swingsia samuiensis TaxID=1293412 RepID=A0A4Y6ULF7_9PROT|nr:hypothetical protein [Swingsia samuiensis]QDH17187.1 hypothetical protein E3D00_06115 [Swingsia samuiensis]
MSYAVLFKCYDWNVNIEKQFMRVKENCDFGDVFIVFDVDQGNLNKVPSQYQVFCVSERDLSDVGLARTGGIWLYSEYLIILFWLKNIHYDYYISLDSSVGVYSNLDFIIQKMEENNIDSLSHDIDTDIGHWPHLGSSIDYYDFKDIDPKLFFISFFSRAAISTIYTKRLIQKKKKVEQNNNTFPVSEVVLGSEIKIMGLKEDKLINYCDNLENYHWNRGIPIQYADEFAEGQTFIYPLLSEDGVISSNTTPDIKKIDDVIIKKAILLNSTYFYIKIYNLKDNTEEDKNYILDTIKNNLKEDSSNGYFFKEKILDGFVVRQSSRSEYSDPYSSEKDVISSVPKGRYNHHTNEETNPFIEVEFFNANDVSEIYLYDRPDIIREYLYKIDYICENGFIITAYQSSHIERLGDIVSGPKVININEKIRSIRISIIGKGMLHLDSIIICRRTETD